MPELQVKTFVMDGATITVYRVEDGWRYTLLCGEVCLEDGDFVTWQAAKANAMLLWEKMSHERE